MANYNDLPKKSCLHCGANIRRREDSIPYQASICHKCILAQPKYIEIKRKMSALRQQKFYRDHREEEKARMREVYAKSKDS